MATSIELLCALHFLVIGLSHLLRHREWAEVFGLLRKHPSGGALLSGMISLGMGSLIVVFHNVWSDASVMLTVLGWAFVIKGSLWLLFPGLGQRSLARVNAENSRKFGVAGVAMVGLAVYCGACALLTLNTAERVAW